MSEVNNTNVFDASRKFVDFAGLDYFWSKAKTYIDDVDATMSTKVLANETAIKGIQDELNTLSGGVGSVGTQIDNAIAALDLPGTYEAKGSAAQALVDAKAYADGKVDGKFDATGSAAQALVDAKAYADGLAVNYDAAGAAATAKAEAIADAKVYADGLASNYDAAGAAATAKAEAIAQAKADATEVLKSYYTKTEVDNLLSTNSTGDRAYAKQYTDELFNSFKFAQNSDIDALFAAKAE